MKLVVLPDREVDELLEYSRGVLPDVPTGTRVGKRWKAFDREFVRHLRTYTWHPEPGKVGIRTEILLTETEAAALAGAVFWWLP